MRYLRIATSLLLLGAGLAGGQGVSQPESGEIVPGLLEIKLKPDVLEKFDRARIEKGERVTGLESLDALNRQEGVQAIELPPAAIRDRLLRPRLMCLLKFGPGTDVEKLVQKYAKNKHVEYAAPVVRYRTLLAPDDPLFPDQWSHDAAHLRSAAAWDLSTGDPGVPIAFIDTGMDWQHEDLTNSLWINSAEDANGNGRFDNAPFPDGDLDGVDADGNGKVDDVIGWDFWGRDPNPAHTSGDHGTKTAGIAVAGTHNGTGVAGAAGGWGADRPGCPVMVLRVGAGTYVYSTYVWQAIDYARLNGAKVINMSFAGSYSPSVEAAVQDAWEAGILLTAGAGSSSTNDLKYPAAYKEVMAVNGTQEDDTKQDGSPWGIVVDVSAPGDDLWTTVPGGGYVRSPGVTPSLATAQVTGLAGLVFSYLGADAPVDRVYATIKYSTDYITGTSGITADYWGFVGTGRINAHSALQMAGNTLVVPDQYPTIAAAVSAADAGQTVYVRPGAYSGDIAMKSGVRLIGARSDLTTIEGSVYFSGAAGAELSGFTVEDYIGVYISNSPDGVVRNCRIRDAYWGVLVYSCSPMLRHNEIVDNGVGVYLGSNAGTGVEARNNRIDGNGKGFYVRSTPTLYYRHNSIKNSGIYDLYATAQSGIIVALGNWWGEDPPDPSQIVTANGIYYFSHLTHDPIPAGHTPPKRVVPSPPSGDREEEDPQPARDLYTQGRQSLEDGQLEAAVDAYRQLVAAFPDARLAQVALKEMVGTYHRLGRAAAARSYLRELGEEDPGSRMGQAVRLLQFDLLLLQGKYAAALALARTLQQELRGTEAAEELAFEAARIQRFDMDRKGEGETALKAYLDDYPATTGDASRQQRRALARAFLGERPDPEGVAAGRGFGVAESARLEIEGPNPFNPQTAVAVELDAPASVSLQIFNTAGQRVRTLTDGAVTPAGRQRLLWDGLDDQGRPVASGVYLVRLAADGQFISRKLTLLR